MNCVLICLDYIFYYFNPIGNLVRINVDGVDVEL